MPELVFIKFTDYSQFFFLLRIFLRRVKACGFNFYFVCKHITFMQQCSKCRNTGKKNLLQKMQENKILLLKSQHLCFLLKKKKQETQQQNKATPN